MNQNQGRLDEKRRMRSEYSVHQREAGRDSNDRILVKRAKQGVMMFAMTYLAKEIGLLDIDLPAMDIILPTLLLGAIIVSTERPCLLIPDEISARVSYSEDIPDGEMVTITCFNHAEFARMVTT